MTRPQDGNDMLTTLEKLEPGERAVIKEIQTHGSAEADLMEMGLTSGTQIRLVKFAPLGDPLEIEIRGYHLSIRRSEATEILVVRNNSEPAETCKTQVKSVDQGARNGSTAATPKTHRSLAVALQESAHQLWKSFPLARAYSAGRE